MRVPVPDFVQTSADVEAACRVMEPIKPEHADKVERIAGADPRLTIRRRLVAYAYPRNGNLHNPTPEYAWDLMCGDQRLDTASRRRVLVEAARTSGAAYLAEVS